MIEKASHIGEVMIGDNEISAVGRAGHTYHVLYLFLLELVHKERLMNVLDLDVVLPLVVLYVRQLQHTRTQ